MILENPPNPLYKGEFRDREVCGKEILDGEEGRYRDCRVWDDIS